MAIAQTKLVLEMLEASSKAASFEVVTIKTAGDVSSPAGADGKAAFTGEIEAQLVDGKIDLAVHSMKDLPTETDSRLALAATPVRGDPRDALVTTSGTKLSELRKGAKLGTSSLRRRAQLLSIRNDLEVVELHGNVETRLRKMGDERLDGIVLAAAGLERLGLGSKITQLFHTSEVVPAPCQGIIAVQTARKSKETLALLRKIDDASTRLASECERAFSADLGGDCDLPLGAFAAVDGERLDAIGVLAYPDGTRVVKASSTGDSKDAKQVGRELAAKVIRSGGGEILERLGR
ncbi:MAG: hydroxymethylbilane synthase [Nitrososphaerota archaeon]|nr:hydroxymethylbilane synthase [Nitrososphaerota archaeon]